MYSFAPRSLSSVIVAVLCFLPARPADACAWDNETYHAEAKTLPCVADTLLGFTPEHTTEYYEARLAAMEAALAIVPSWLEGLDGQGIALLHLGRLGDGVAVLRKRFDLAPDDYPGHANLGTIYTFMGRFDEAETHIRAAMAMEPDAHFGREGVHLQFVEHLKAVEADPTLAGQNFMGLEMTKTQRLTGSLAKFSAAGYTQRELDALVAMLTVYGAKDHPDLLYALGDLLALKGMKRLAWTAYHRARRAKHPHTGELYTLEKALSAELRKEWEAKNPSKRGDYSGEGAYGKLEGVYVTNKKMAETFRSKYQRWERGQVRDGLEVWTDEGLGTVYAEMERRRPRCKVAPLPKRADPAGEVAESQPSAEGL